MAYYTDLFSPETYEAFTRSKQDTSGFRRRQENAAARIQEGDKLLCYMTHLGRWIGVLEVQGPYFTDETPLFYETDDPFVIRVKVKPIVWLPKEKGMPIRDDRVWNSLSFTKGHDKNGSQWTGKLRNSLRLLDNNDGAYLEHLLVRQAKGGDIFEVDEGEYAKHVLHRVHRSEGLVTVSVPQEIEGKNDIPLHEGRESIRIQALVASIGANMGLKIWLPKADRQSVLAEWPGDLHPLLDVLPLNYDETTIRTIEQIDVLWLKGRAIVRAFEVEHTTSIYSGILRMADLLALQPNMNIRLHIVAPHNRRERVFQEIQRPVFSLLDGAPLSQRCTYISYDSIEDLARLPHLSHISDSILDEYDEEVE